MYSNFRVAVEYTDKLTIESIYNALSHMVLQHSSLSMNAYLKKNPFYFQFPYLLGFMNSYRLSDVLDVINNKNLTVQDVFNQLENKHFHYGTGKPLWSLILLNSHTLIYYSDHLLFDGSSGLNFHKVFSHALKIKPEECISKFHGIDSILFDINKVNSNFYLTPKPSDLIDYSVPFLYILYVIMIFCLPKSFSNIIKYYFIDGDISKSKTYNTILLSNQMVEYNYIQEYKNDHTEKKYDDNCKLVHISQFKLQKLIDDCRKYNVKLTSLLVVVSLLSIARITGEKRDTIVVIPVNSRNKILKEKANDVNEEFKDDFGLYLGDLNLELPPVDKVCSNGQINWDFVKYINDYIHGSLKNSQRDLGLVSWVDSKMFLQHRKSLSENSMIGTLLVSNLGNLKDTDNSFVNAYFDQPCKSGVLSLFAMNVISTSNGGANLTLHSVKEVWLDVFSEGVKYQLSQI